jgi:hypothetical protein
MADQYEALAKEWYLSGNPGEYRPCGMLPPDVDRWKIYSIPFRLGAIFPA